MSDRVRELGDRRAALQLRCAAQRQAVAREVQGLTQRLRTVDRVAAVTRGALLHPAVVAVGMALMVAIGRSRMWQLVGRGLVVAAGVRRLLRAAKKI